MQQNLSNIAILIPAYDPTEHLLPILDDLYAAGFLHILVVNDGSNKQHQALFDKVGKKANVTLLNHAVNLGKGEAIKTGFRFINNNLTHQVKGVITADADGQHLVKDIVKVANTLQEEGEALVLGEREFGQDVPLRSRFGNILTRKLFSWIYRRKIRDTQTGLRGMTLALMRKFIDIPYGGYEFELECLIETINAGYVIKQVDIETVYIDDNASSHFNPVVDSVRIYFVFFRYIIVALLSFLLDLVIFLGIHAVTQSIFFSLVVARFCSGVFNFYQNKYQVYKAKDKATIKKEVMSYILLAILIFLVSYTFITVLHHWLGLRVITAKILGDGILFVISFIIQKIWVFKGTVAN